MPIHIRKRPDPCRARSTFSGTLKPAVVQHRDGDGHEINYLTVGLVAKRFPPSRDGRPVHAATVTRWIVDGARLPDGSRRRLRAIRGPGRWLVEPEAIEEFLDALTADRATNQGRETFDRLPVPAARTGADQSAAALREHHEQVAGKLDDFGICESHPEIASGPTVPAQPGSIPGLAGQRSNVVRSPRHRPT
jgi:hypothetical protein